MKTIQISDSSIFSELKMLEITTRVGDIEGKRFIKTNWAIFSHISDKASKKGSRMIHFLFATKTANKSEKPIAEMLV